MLSNAYFLAKFRFDTAENEPAKKLQNFAKNCKFLKCEIAKVADPEGLDPLEQRPLPAHEQPRLELRRLLEAPRLRARVLEHVRRGAEGACARSQLRGSDAVTQTWRGSFSAVSKPMFENKY